jgi:GDP-fucose transporter C1
MHKKSTPPPRPQAKKEHASWIIIGVVSFYFVVSISTVFLNKVIFEEDSQYSFPYPLTTTLYQLIVALVCILLTYPLNRHVSALSFLPDFEFKIDTAIQVLPLTIIYVCMLAFNNLCLNYVDVQLYQIARSLSICFTVLFGYLLLGEKSSMKLLVACGVVIAGYVIGAIGKISDFSQLLSLFGMVFGLLSSAFVALNSIYVKKKLVVVNDNNWILTIYNTVNAIVLMFVLSLVTGELNQALQVPFLFHSKFIVLMTFTGIIGFLINIAVFLQIKYTTALTNTISGTAKACVQSLLAFLFFKSDLSSTSLFGLVLSIAGSGWYTNVKRVENQQAQADREAKMQQLSDIRVDGEEK